MNISFFDQLDIKKIFDPARIFESTPNPEGLYQYLSIVFGLLLVIALIIIFLTRKQKQIFKNYFNRIVNILLFAGLTGLILVFCRWQGIPYLGSRLMMYVLLLILIIWGSYTIWYRLVFLPKKITELKAKERFEKYLPKKKGNN